MTLKVFLKEKNKNVDNVVEMTLCKNGICSQRMRSVRGTTTYIRELYVGLETTGVEN